jgi:YHS domain-containing protein
VPSRNNRESRQFSFLFKSFFGYLQGRVRRFCRARAQERHARAAAVHSSHLVLGYSAMKMNNALVAAALFALPLTACEKKSQSAQPSAAAPAATAAAPSTANAAVGDDPAVPKLAVGTKAHCAVTGEEFTVKENTVQVTYNGKRYAFCCADCQPTFAKNPAKYAKN